MKTQQYTFFVYAAKAISIIYSVLIIDMLTQTMRKK